MSAPADLDVSRETKERLEIYADLLTRWNPRINLVSKSSLADIWSRHIADSAQIWELAKHPVRHWADLGSGGGFPGLVIAIMAQETGSPERVTLVESDARKCAFLRTVIRETGIAVQVAAERIELMQPLQADVISARALAGLNQLLFYCDHHLAQKGVALFPKGVTWEKELEAAQTEWNFRYQVVNSRTEVGPVILTVTGVSRV